MPHSGPTETLAKGPDENQDVLLARGAQIDAGFNAKVLVGMIAILDRFTDDELPVHDGSSAAEMRTFYSTWRSELAA